MGEELGHGNGTILKHTPDKASTIYPPGLSNFESIQTGLFILDFTLNETFVYFYIIYESIYLEPISPLFFGLPSFKTRPFQIKTRVNWAPCMYKVL